MSKRFTLARMLIAASFLGAALGGNAYAQEFALDAYNRGAAIGAQQARERQEQTIRDLIILGEIERLKRAAEERAQSEREKQLAIEREKKARQEEERQRVQAEEAKRNAMSTGTGFFVRSDGYLVTNHHVIEDKGQFAVRALDGKFYRAQVVARDAKRDLALLKVEGQFPALHVLDSKVVTKGQRVMAVGYPNISIQGNESKVTDGIISSFSGLRNNDGWFQISVPVQGGNSGGPLVNESGSVVGVVVATVNVGRYFSQSGNLPQNVNYAIKSEMMLDFLKENSISGSVKAPKKIGVNEVDKATVLVIAGNNLEKLAYSSTPTAPAIPEAGQPLEKSVPKAAATVAVDTPTKIKQSVDEVTDGEIFYRRGKNHLGNNQTQNAAFAFGAALKAGHPQALQALLELYPKPIESLRNDAERGNVSAQSDLADMFYYGIGTGSDRQEALSRYSRAAEGGHLNSQYAFGINGSRPEWVKKAAEGGHPRAMASVGIAYFNGTSFKREPKEGVRLLSSAAEKGDGYGQKTLGLLYLLGIEVQMDHSEARKWFGKAANNGDEEAQYYLGRMFEEGLGGAKNIPEAKKWYLLASRNGSALATDSLKILQQPPKKAVPPRGDPQGIEAYSDGQAAIARGDFSGAILNLRRARNYGIVEAGTAMTGIHRVAELGNPDALLATGLLYDSGWMVIADRDWMHLFFRKAAELGNVSAQRKMRDNYGGRFGLKKDEEYASYWLKKLADTGDSESQFRLGQAYRSGRLGMPVDSDQAILWLSRASSQGNKRAARELQEMEQR